MKREIEVGHTQVGHAGVLPAAVGAHVQLLEV